MPSAYGRMYPMRKNVVITGAANGIGKALSELFLNENATVWGIDRDEKNLLEIQNKTKKYAQNFHPFICDISDLKALESTAKEIFAQSGGIDTWVNNAGISGLGDFMNSSMEEFQKVIQINLLALVQGTKLAISHMEPAGKGTVVNIASVAGHIAAPYLAAYSASKFAVVGFSAAVREELKLKVVPIKIVVVSPGFVNTKIIEKGSQFGFPDYLSFLLADANSVAREVFEGIRRGQENIFPSLHGKVLAKMGRYFPNVTIKGSRILLSKSFKDLVLFRKLPPP